MSRWIYDIETDGLYMQATRMWILAAYNLDTDKMYYFLEGDLGWKDLFKDARLVAGHNIIGFDNLVLKKLFDYEFPETCKIQDTLIMSRVLDYRRFGDDGHSLERWGEYFDYPKGDHSDWSQYSDEMRDYCLQDVRLNVRVHKHLIQEFDVAYETNAYIAPYMRAEHAVAQWCAMAYAHGWPFNLEKAHKLKAVLEVEMLKATDALEERLGYRVKPKDKSKGVIEVKMPKWVKSGFYDKHTSDYFGVDPVSGDISCDRPVAGPFVRIEVEPLKLSSSNDVKTFLFRHGWEPTEFNTKWDPEKGRKIETSPKITDDSLEFLGGDGALYTEYKTAVSRYGVLKGWIENTDEKGLLHGDCITIGTPSMRARHSIIVNVPAGESKYGKEMRELFGTLPGWTLIGCDSASNQARGLAHFLGNDEFTNTLINGDIHTFNAQALDQVLQDMGVDWSEYIIENDIAEIEEEAWIRYNSKEGYLRHSPDGPKALAKVKRAAAKRILYAFLFGASGKKLWSYIFGVQNAEKGNKLKNGFMKAVPGFKPLMTKLEGIYGGTKKKGDGWIPSLAGTAIYVDSFHKLLVYLLQSTEKITCSLALMLAMERLKAANIPYIPVIFMHDEIDFMVPDKYAEQASEIARQCFKDGPALVGVNIMDGGSKIGTDWFTIH